MLGTAEYLAPADRGGPVDGTPTSPPALVLYEMVLLSRRSRPTPMPPPLPGSPRARAAEQGCSRASRRGSSRTILACLARDPADRPDSATEVRHRLASATPPGTGTCTCMAACAPGRRAGSRHEPAAAPARAPRSLPAATATAVADHRAARRDAIVAALLATGIGVGSGDAAAEPIAVASTSAFDPEATRRATSTTARRRCGRRRRGDHRGPPRPIRDPSGCKEAGRRPDRAVRRAGEHRRAAGHILGTNWTASIYLTEGDRRATSVRGARPSPPARSRPPSASFAVDGRRLAGGPHLDHPHGRRRAGGHRRGAGLRLSPPADGPPGTLAAWPSRMTSISSRAPGQETIGPSTTSSAGTRNGSTGSAGGWRATTLARSMPQEALISVVGACPASTDGPPSRPWSGSRRTPRWTSCAGASAVRWCHSTTNGRPGKPTAGTGPSIGQAVGDRLASTRLAQVPLEFRAPVVLRPVPSRLRRDREVRDPAGTVRSRIRGPGGARRCSGTPRGTRRPPRPSKAAPMTDDPTELDLASAYLDDEVSAEERTGRSRSSCSPGSAAAAGCPRRWPGGPATRRRRPRPGRRRRALLAGQGRGPTAGRRPRWRPGGGRPGFSLPARRGRDHRHRPRGRPPHDRTRGRQ